MTLTMERVIVNYKYNKRERYILNEIICNLSRKISLGKLIYLQFFNPRAEFYYKSIPK